MKQKGFVSVILAVVALAIVSVVAYFVFNQQYQPFQIVNSNPRPVPVGCTQEAKQCPDGSYVGRVGPKCEFAACPKPAPPVPIPGPGDCNVSPDQNGNCPAGCVNYGVPLGCVTQQYYEGCRDRTHPCPICLSGDTLIGTPFGPVSVKNLKVGMPVLTTSKAGESVLGVILQTSRVPVPPTHQMVHLILVDGRELFASPGHPTIDGRTVGDLLPGDIYNGARVISAERVSYDQGFTYDILPSGDTGFYFANGVLLGSTLRQSVIQ